MTGRRRTISGVLLAAVMGLVGAIGPVTAHQTASRTSGPGEYVVRKGDTLARVAARLGVTVSSLAQANRITDPNRVRAGQVIVVPKVGERPASPPLPIPTEPLPSPVFVAGEVARHKVAPGETLGQIAATYGTTVTALVAANGLKDPNQIREGRELEVPGPRWLCPVQGASQYSDSWGAPRPGGRRHLGIDLFAVRGTPVVASVSGVLIHANGATAGLAYYLRGLDGTIYYGAHLDTLEAGPGPVAQGARIGSVGATGNARGTTPHLHFEVKPGGADPVNPLPTIERWCRR